MNLNPGWCELEAFHIGRHVVKRHFIIQRQALHPQMMQHSGLQLVHEKTTNNVSLKAERRRWQNVSHKALKSSPGDN